MATPKKKTKADKGNLKKKASHRNGFKKTRSSPHPRTMSVLRALRKTKSMNCEISAPLSSPPKTVKKAISENLQKKISKKRKREKVVTKPDNTQGLKLLKRGCVTMHRIVKRKIRGIKLSMSLMQKESHMVKKKIHKEQQERRKLSKYPHRMSRKGYANLENDAEEVDRSDTWILARMDEDGNFLNDEVAEKAKEIKKMKEEVKEGKLKVEGTNDVLTMALGKPEHGGRVCGQGIHVKQSVYFDLPRGKKRGQWKKGPKPNSQQESCHSKGGVDVDVDVGDHKNVTLIDNLFVDLAVELEDNKKVAGEDDNGRAVEEMKVDSSGGSVCRLDVGSLSNIVACATIDEVRVPEGHEKTIHGVSLGEKNARVSITKVIQGDAKIPFPIGDEILTVQEAMRTFIAWPRNMIIAGNNSSTSHVLAAKKTKKARAKKMKKMYKVIEDVEPELVVQIGPNYPSAMKRLCTWAKEALSGGRTISFELSKEAFGFTKKQIMFLSDIHAVCSGGEMAGSVICLFIHFLNEYVKKHKMVNMISFVDPGTIGAIGCGSAVQRSRELCTRFKDSRKGQHFLLPYNDVNHWTLTVVNPDAEVVYYMDPLKRRIANGEWVNVVDNAIKMYKEDLKKVLKKKVLWENMAGVPVQTGNKDCGMFVMRYMMEIIHDKELDFANKATIKMKTDGSFVLKNLGRSSVSVNGKAIANEQSLSLSSSSLIELEDAPVLLRTRPAIVEGSERKILGRRYRRHGGEDAPNDIGRVLCLVLFEEFPLETVKEGDVREKLEGLGGCPFKA
ncbi:hypothetical protein AgCh_032225 [Apium graveolens]